MNSKMFEHIITSGSSKNLLLVTNKLEERPRGGRQLLCKLNHDLLKEIYGSRLVLYELSRKNISNVKKISNALFGYIDGINNEVIIDILSIIKNIESTQVIVDGSNLGTLVKFIKQSHPEVEIVTFFHNVEARFFLGALRQYKTFRAFAVLLVNYFAEKNAVKFSDKLICLSERDSEVLKCVYGRSATHVSAIALNDKRPIGFSINPSLSISNFALFVGGDFYANRAGIIWFVKQVVPFIDIKICIVGRGFEDLQKSLEVQHKVQVIGEVASLVPWYQDAHFVIAPIFDGSGMKTKVAEALMFGKKIIGTSEAFSGYADLTEQAGWECKTANDFINAIKSAQMLPLLSFDPELRSIYEKKYSFSAARKRMMQILNQDSIL